MNKPHSTHPYIQLFKLSLLLWTSTLISCTAAFDFADECSSNTDCPSSFACISGFCSEDATENLEPEPAPKTAFLYVGPVGDHGWTKTHNDGRLELEESITGIDTTFEPSVSPADAPKVIDRLISEGNNLIIGTSYDFLNAIQSAAANNPDVRFLLCSGFVSSPNLGSYFGRMYEVKYLAGRLAGQMTTSNKLGYVSSIIVPETIRHVNAFTLGAKSVNPDAVVMVNFIGEWFNPDSEAAAANEMMNFGVDVITNGTDTPVTIQEADKRRDENGNPAVWSIGYDNPTTCELFAPETCLASAYYNWGPVLETQVNSMMDRTWDPNAIIWESMKGAPEDSIVHLMWGETNLVPQNVRLDIESFFDDFSSGSASPFEGIVSDNKGGQREILNDEDLLRMCWLTDGVVEPGPGPTYTPKTIPPGCQGDN